MHHLRSICIKLAVPVLAFAILAFAITASLHAQSPAVQSLQKRLLSPPAAVTLNIAELRLSRLPHAELKVVGGTPRPGIMNLKLDSDEVAHQNDTLTVRSVEGTSEKKNDVLRITVATPSGATAKLAFQLEKGALDSMDEAALEQAMGPVIAAQGGPPSAGMTGSRSAPPAPMAPIPPPPPPPDAPEAGVGAHSSKNLDLPPAAPGFPPMHAENPAMDGCWYESYLSAKWNVEFAYPQCSKDSSMGSQVTIADGPNGPVVRKTRVAEDLELFTVYEKRPDETLRAAVKRVIIDKMRDPAARLACKATESTDPSGRKTVEVTATGPYTRRSSYPLSKGGAKSGLPCDGLIGSEGEDATDYPFLEFPSENKTVFILIPNDKGSFEFPAETIHFSGKGVANASTESAAVAPKAAVGQKTAQVSANQNAKLPPMKDVWLSQGRGSRDLADEASTVVSFTHGMAIDSRDGDAILAIACEKSAGGSGLYLHFLTPVYQGMQQTLTNNSATLNMGNASRRVTIAAQPGRQFLDVAVPMNQDDVAQMSETSLAGQRTIGLLYFNGAGQDIAAGDVPPANEAFDAVLHACQVTTPTRVGAQPQRQLSPSDIDHLQLARLTLGMSEAEVRQALGAGYRFQPGDGGKFTSLSFLLATDNSNSYGMTFFNHALRAFTYRKAFAPGSQPLIVNLINDLTSKTWLPLAGSSVSGTSWSSDANGVPITLATQNSHPNCGVVRQDSTGAPPPFRGTTTVNLLDTGPDCGVTVRLELTQASDRTMARDMLLLVVDYRPIHALVAGVKSQQQQQTLDERKKAGQVATPF